MSKIISQKISDNLKPAPTGLIMASLLLWGWQANFLIYAFIIGLILELPRFINWRLELSDKDINQLADLSGVLFFVVTIYAFNNFSFRGIYKILELLPFALILLMLAQQYTNRNGIKTSALFISIRRLGDKASPDVLYNINLDMPYVFICLIAASSGNKYENLFFIFSTLIIIWYLWSIRPRHFSTFHWLMPICIVVSVAFMTQYGLTELQNKAESIFLGYFEKFGWKSRDPYRTSTAIGSLGRLKMSDRIMMRVKSDKKLDNPVYFHESSYVMYEYGIWRNPAVEFDVISKTPNKNEWRLHQEHDDKGFYDVALYLDSKSAIIPVPKNINSLSGQDLIQVETNIYDATRIEARKGWISYRTGLSGEKANTSIEPDKEDIEITPRYLEDIKKVAQQLDLYSKSNDEIINTVERYFKDNFYYSITQNQRYPKGKYLRKFLFETKKGHCEYFATATALLLREAGIPARYTLGYSVQEYSPWQKMYLIRARHAHSWVSYYRDGQWQILDTTPSTWAPLEAEDRSFLEPFMDMLSWLRFKITGSEIEDDKEKSDNWYLWLLIPLFLYLSWRFYHKQTTKHDDDNKKISLDLNIDRDGLDSPIFYILENLERNTDKRNSGETLINWITRILPKEKIPAYLELIKLHYRYRFNPKSNKKDDKRIILEKLKSFQNV